MRPFRIAKAKVAGSNPVFRSKLPGFRKVGGSGRFHGRRLWRRSRRFPDPALGNQISAFKREVERAALRGERHGLEQRWNISFRSRSSLAEPRVPRYFTRDVHESAQYG